MSEQGEDTGDCTLPIRPCRTIAYAQSVVGKGGQVRVASGTYELRGSEEIFNLTSGVIDIRGGYNRFDHFLQQAPQANQTTLVGVPAQYRDVLRKRGFHVISDFKSIDLDQQRALAELHHTFDATSRSSARNNCVQGRAGSYRCDKIDLLSHMALRDFFSRPSAGNDVWGFVDLNTEREYALVGLYNGASVVDVTDPESPFEVGFVSGIGTAWRDLKVVQTYDEALERWNAYAYVSGESPAHLLVIDLTDLPNRISLGHRLLESSIHNVYVSNVDYASGVPLEGAPLLQALGARRSGGKFLSFDLMDPLLPTLKSQSTSGYSHDATSMVVTDSRTSSCASSGQSCEVLIDFNEATFDLWDFSDQSAPKLLSSTPYAGASYVHSGWWSDDGRYLFVQDELDERFYGLRSTLRIFDLANLENPRHAGTWTGPTRAIDHNGYVRGNRYYMSNYTRGVTVIDITDPSSPDDVGYFDTYPVSDSVSFVGAWGVFPFLPSGNLLVSDIGTGLYVLEEHTRESVSGELGFGSRSYGGVEGQTLSVSVQRSDGSTGAIGVDYSIYAGSAGSADVTLSTGSLSWTAGDSTARSISVPLLQDSDAEPVERAFVRLSNPSGGAVLADVNMASLFVADAGSSARLEFAEEHIEVEEDSARAIVTVKRTGSPMGAVSASLETYPGTALAGSDYVVPTETAFTWADGDATARTLVIDLIADDVDESAETFGVRLVSVTGATQSDADAQVEIGGDSDFAVTGIMLYDNVIAQDTRAMSDGIRLGENAVTASRLNFRAMVRDDDAIGSLQFDLSGPVSAQRTISGGSDGLPEGRLLLLGGVDQGNTELTEGHYQITATPYADSDLGGATGRSVSMSFVVGNPAPPASDDAGLGALSLSGIEFSFDGDTQSYNLSVAHEVSVTTVSATTSHESAGLSISPEDSNDAEDGHQVQLAVGTTEISITVTAEDGVTTKTYSLSLQRAEASLPETSADATLSSLSLSGVSFAFASDTQDYILVYDQLMPVTTVTATTTDEGASFAIQPADAISILDGHQVALGSGLNEITVSVTAEDGTTTKTYSLQVYRIPTFRVFETR